ncbi:cytosolic carboxypeptidase 6 isoform X8 [Canis lupus familiaris]|uniref:cytosolic carboxypeptidase 6 isoform X6 n=1 Tax=Canis lupus dingo TaxID=286419 RepID=UPI0015F166A8|nr:cytosolic carboxypeptidase 6 isoform X6 [Canis lupus dingo]XP_038304992.1 cytosolic carboxypeptidase 6 isoform X8 [Canis lupus familiaris]XP_038414021.1 cytosolic carboxypeptidase 6 isoform X8 [Canis lupus familiaris]XP_038543647.1 cytosolic carboxypeptidase 6 isoform X8 [Canis lupus familiaris]
MQRVIFNIVNFSKTKSLYRDGMAPMVKSTSRPKWQRLPPKNVYYYRCPDHRKNYVMSFAFCFDREEDIYQFAYCYPYTYTRFQHYLDGLQKRNMDYFFREQLGQSVQQRQLDLLTITSPEDKSDLENSVMQKKIKIPKLSLNHIEEDGEVKDYGEEDLQLRHLKRPEGRKPSEVAHKSIEAVVARLEKQNGLSLGHGTCPEEVFVEASPGTEDMDSLEDAVVPRALYEELLRNYQQQQEEMRHLQQELERTRRQLVQQAKKLKEYGALVSEMKELRDLNRRLQDVLLLRLGSDNLREGAEKKVVFITGRVHPGETPSSFVCQGIIDFLISQHPIAHVLREHLVFKIAPMLNPDGVYLGNYRCSLMGFDLNRHWLDPSPWAHPTLHGVKQLIIQMYNDPKTSLEFYIDIHAHSTMMNGFMYGNIFEDEERFQRQAIFPKLLCQNAEDFSYSSTSFNRDAVKAGTGRRFLGGLLDHTSYCYTLEVSFYSYIIGGTTAAVPYTEEACILGGSPQAWASPHPAESIQVWQDLTGRYEAGKERGKNVFGLLSAEPPGGESGDPGAEAAERKAPSLQVPIPAGPSQQPPQRQRGQEELSEPQRPFKLFLRTWSPGRSCGGTSMHFPLGHEIIHPSL